MNFNIEKQIAFAFLNFYKNEAFQCLWKSHMKPNHNLNIRKTDSGPFCISVSEISCVT